MQRLRVRIFSLALGMLLATGVSAQQSVDQAQLDAFKNLPPDQQEAVLQSIGTEGVDATGVVGARDGVRRDKSLDAPQTVKPRSTRQGDKLAAEDMLEPLEPVFKGGDNVLLDVRVRTTDPLTKAPRKADEVERNQAVVDRVLRMNPFKLDAGGTLRVPGVAPIQLAGMTVEQATARLNQDPNLRNFQILLTLLPHMADDLKPFGYDLFAGVPSTFAPVSDIPVPSEYVVGPGDRLEVQLVGKTKGRYSLVVNRDGRVMFPELGPINVAGLRFEAAKARIEARVAEQMIGTQATVSIGDLRSIRVFVLGEAEVPGSYTVGGLATVTNALFASGGIKTIGSLRHIQLKRNGILVQRLDLYDLLLRGDTSGDVRLQPGDVIFIPPVGATVGVAGEILRPAIYELRGGETAADLLRLAGGLTPVADPKLARIERIDERRNRVVLDADLTNPASRAQQMRTGDVLRIPGARPDYADTVQLGGHVHRPGSFQYRSGMRLTDMIPSVQELKPNADLGYVLIRREQADTRRIEVVSADLTKAWRAPSSVANPTLAPRDQVFVFDFDSGRDLYLTPILYELKLQSDNAEPSQIVRVTGEVRADGEYPLEPGMRISDLIRAGGGLSERAYAGEAELARYETRDGYSRRTDIIKVDLQRVLAGDPGANLVLGPFDTLVIKGISEWEEREVVTLEGEVRFPGEYPIERGETLGALIKRAGGLTALAFPDGSVFTRETLKERERQQISTLVRRMRQDLGSLALQGSQLGGAAGQQAAETLAIGKTLLEDLQTAEPVGRLVVDLNRAMLAAPGTTEDVVLKGGDRLRVPKRAQEVTVIGEVQSPTSHLYDPSLGRDDYVRMSGGTTQRADRKRIYIVRANGSVEAGSGSRWFQQGSSTKPGDTVVVPLDAERMRPLPLWTAVSTIIFNLAVAVAAVGSM